MISVFAHASKLMPTRLGGIYRAAFLHVSADSVISNAQRAGAVPHMHLVGDNCPGVVVDMYHLSERLLSVFRHVA